MASKVTVVIVNYNGLKFLKPCFDSIINTTKDDIALDIVMVDNLSVDGSVEYVNNQYPGIRTIINTENNYAKALNIAIASCPESEYIALLNNDTIVEKDWLASLVKLINNSKNIGAVQSKIFFSDRSTINSAGVEEVEDFYFRDIGFGQKDSRKYNKTREIDYFSGGSVLLRRECIDDVGRFDEDFIMYCEDIDYSIRCKASAWKIFYCPDSIVYHEYNGTASSSLCEYFCSRNRLFCIAKHFPDRLAASLTTSHFFNKHEYSNLHNALITSVKKAMAIHGTDAVCDLLADLKKRLPEIIDGHAAHNFFSHLELALGIREKIKIGIYDHAFQFAGGGQRYVATIAEFLQDEYDITYISNKEIKLENYHEWFNIDLSRCKIKIIPIQFFESRSRYFIDEGMVVNEASNPFDIISNESINYDIFINANMLGKVEPFSLFSMFICHFPDRDIERFFKVHKYNFLISNGDYTSSWINKRWGLQPTHKLYPPVDMSNPETSAEVKQKIILSVARVEMCGSKKQVELIKAFSEMSKLHPAIGTEWTLVLAGGNSKDNYYFDQVKTEAKRTNARIVLKPNVSYLELKDLYRDAAVFWHACGLNESSPHLVEHFGMTTVEAMQNYCVPIVINGGGQVEIVVDGISGFRFNTLKELQDQTIAIISDPVQMKNVAENAFARSQNFDLAVFQKQVLEIMSAIKDELLGEEFLPSSQPAASQPSTPER